jgi:ABC-type nitrate/sulfonate/bicarbonate transport system permease component
VKVKTKRYALALWIPVTVLVTWQASVWMGLLDPLFFPPPTTLVSAAGRLIESGELGQQLRITLTRMSLGFLIGAGCGLIGGVLMGAVPVVRQSLEPVVSALYTTPKMSLLPMLMLFLGVGDAPRIVLIAAGSFVMLAMHALDAVRGISFTYLEMAANYGAGRMMIFRKVYLPASLPQIFTGLRLALGRALIITVAVELVSCPDGLGSMIWMSWQTFATEKLYVGVILTASIGALFHNSLRRLETRLIPWRQ